MGAARRHASVWRRWQGTRARVVLYITGALALAIVVMSAFAPALAPQDPYAQDLAHALEPPSAAHLAGCDRYGRDLLSRVIVGAKVSVLSTLVLVGVVSIVGTSLGLVCGWFEGPFDTVLMRIADLFLAFPGLVPALAIASVVGGGMAGAVVSLAAISWPKYTRLARSLVLSERKEPYLAASRLAGCTTPQLIVRHVLPNILGPIIVTAVLDIGAMMMSLAGLSFLGLGAKPPAAEWGSMMSESRSLLQTAPWCVLAPGIAIFVVVAVFNLLGDTVRDVLGEGAREASPVVLRRFGARDGDASVKRGSKRTDRGR